MRSREMLLAAILLAGGAAVPAAAQSVPGSGGWTAGADATGDNTYAGPVDQPTNGSSIGAGSAFHVSGWIVDTTAQGWAGIDDLNVYLGSTPIAHGAVAESRPDVAAATGNGYWANSGFDALVPAGAVPAGNQTLTVVAHTPSKGTWLRQVGVTVTAGTSASGVTVSSASGGAVSPALQVTIQAPMPGEIIPGTNNATIRGTAVDTRTRAELGSGVNRVQVYLDAKRGVAGSQFIGEANISGSTWALNWQPTKYNSERHHVMYVYARSAVTGEELITSQEININS